MTLEEKLLAYALKTYGNDLSRRKDDILDKAADMGFEGDEDALFARLLAAARAAAPAPQARPAVAARPQASGRDTRDIAPWTDDDAALATAPFRFVAVNTAVALHDGTPQSLARPGGTYSAVLKVEWAVETPLLIGEQSGPNAPSTPFRLGNAWAIPGSSLRGMIRSTVETVSFARLQQINRHRRFALRNFLHPFYKDFVLASQADERGQGGMQAGWLQKVGGKPFITPCPWAYVEIEDIRGRTSRPDWVNSDRAGKYGALGITWQGTNAFTRTRAFGPETVDNRRRIRKPAAQGTPGYLVCSGRVPRGTGGGEANKRFEYVFLDAQGASPLPVSDRAWEEFVGNNSKPSANKPTPDGAWKDFARSYEDGGRVPVFFVGSLAENATDPGFSFGLTRLYRIPHRYSIGEMLVRGAKAHRLAEPKVVDGKTVLEHRMDFAEHLFGFVHEPKDLLENHSVAEQKTFTPPAEVSRKSRVAFGFATAAPDAFRLWPDRPERTVLGAPKASFAPFYLTGPEKDWSAADAQLAGRKRYLARYDGTGAETAIRAALQAQTKGITGDVFTHLQFITPARDSARLSGDIRLHNVSAAELGAILWAVGLGGTPGARHLMGRAKAFGAGQVRAAKVTLHLRDNSTNTVHPAVIWEPWSGKDAVKDWLTAFAETIARLTGLKTAEAWEKSDQVRGLLDTCRPVGGTADLTTYLAFQTEENGRQRPARNFARLRDKTGMGAAGIRGRRPPATLLPARRT